MIRFGLCAATVAMAFLPGLAGAHPGRVAADGCHKDRSTGTRHCHGGGSARSAPRQPSAPMRLLGDVARDADYYPSCKIARAAGVTPLRRGDRGYRPGLDRDGDGVACE